MSKDRELPSVNEIRDYYDGFLEYLKRDRERENPRHLKIKSFLQQIIAPGQDVLDLGCGIGITTEFINKIGAKVTGVDLSPKLIEYASATVPGVEFQVGDICGYKSDKKYDVICMIDVLEHIPEDRHQTLFKNLKKLLKKDGKIFISIPNPDYHQKAVEENIGAIQIVEEVIDLEELEKTAAKNGLNLVNKLSYAVWTPDEYVALIFCESQINANHKIVYLLIKYPVLSETFVQTEIEHLISAGAQVEVFSHMPGDAECHLKYPEHVHYIPFDSPEFFKYIQVVNPGHLHTHFANIAYKTTFPTAKELGIPFSFTAHASYDLFNANTKISDAALREMTDHELCTDVICISEYHKDFLVKAGVNPKIISIIPNSVNLENIRGFAKRKSAQKDSEYIVGVGRLIEAKGFKYLIDAFGSIEGDIELRIVGPDRGEGDNLRKAAENDPRIKFLDGCEYQAVITQIKGAKALVAPSVVAADGSRDGIPTVLIEAMACGVPVIASNLSGIPSLVRDGENGILVEPGDSAGLAAAIREIIDDRLLSKRLIDKALKDIKDRDISHTIKKLLPILQKGYVGEARPGVSKSSGVKPLSQEEHIKNHAVASLANGTVLEVGCGQGELSIVLAAHGYETYALSDKPEDIQRGLRKAESAYLDNIKFLYSQQDKLPFPALHFDTVIINNPGETEFMWRVLEETVRVCKSEGRIIITLPSEISASPSISGERRLSLEALEEILNKLGQGNYHQYEKAATGAYHVIYLDMAKKTVSALDSANNSDQEFSEPDLPVLDSSEKVTIVIPTYNRARLLPLAIESAISQTYPNLEIFIVDDGSSDNTADVVQPYIAAHPDKIQFFKKNNAGKSSALNLAISKAGGEYIWILDDDDEGLPKKCEMQVRMFQANPDLGFIHTDAFHYLQDSDQVISRWIAPDLRPFEALRTELRGNVFHTPTVMVRRSVYQRVGDYDEKLIRAQDYDMWIRILAAGFQVGALNAPTVIYRLHEQERGSENDRFQARRLIEKTIEYERIIFAKIRGLAKPEAIYPEINDAAEPKKKEISAASLIYRASVINARGLPEIAEKDLKEAKKLGPRDPETRKSLARLTINIAKAYMGIGKASSARSLLKGADKMELPKIEVHRLQVQAGYAEWLDSNKTQDLMEFLKLLKKALMEHPYDPELLLCFSKIAEHLGEKSIAEKYYEKIAAMKPDSREPTERISVKNRLKPQIKADDVLRTLFSEIEAVLREPTLTVTLIAKDEEENIGKCLASIQGIADEIILVDTGSTDRTVEIAKSFGAKILHQSWEENFSKPRNYALDEAQSDWVMYLDADEEIAPEDKNKLRQLLFDHEAECWFFTLQNFVGEQLSEDAVLNSAMRMWRHRPQYRFEGALHEQIYNKIAQGGTSKLADIRINHFGYLNKLIEDKNKIDRNLEIAQDVVKLRPNDSFALFNLGVEYFRRRSLEEALESFRKSFLNLPHLKVQYAHMLVFNLAVTLKELTRYDEALDIIMQAKEAYPDFPDLFYLEAIINGDKKDFRAALAALDRCMAINGDNPDYVRQKALNAEKAVFSKGRIYEMMGDIRQAVREYTVALKVNSRYLDAISRLGMLMLNGDDDPHDVKVFLDKNVDLRNFRVLECLYDLFAQKKKHQIAWEYLEKALEIFPEMPLRKLKKANALLHIKEYGKAEVLYRDLQSDSSSPQISSGLVFVQLLQRKEQEAQETLAKSADIPEATKTLYSWWLNGPDTNRNVAENLGKAYWGMLEKLIELEEYECFEKCLRFKVHIVDDEAEDELRLGKLFYRGGFLNLAGEHLLISAAENKCDAEGWAMLSRIAELDGEKEDAVVFLKQSLTLDSEVLGNYTKLASLLSEIGYKQECQEVLELAKKKFPHTALLQKAAEVAKILAS